MVNESISRKERRIRKGESIRRSYNVGGVGQRKKSRAKIQAATHESNIGLVKGGIANKKKQDFRPKWGRSEREKKGGVKLSIPSAAFSSRKETVNAGRPIFH